MNYFKKENGRSTQDPLSDKERTMGLELEKFLSKNFSHIPIGGSEKILPSGHTLTRTASQWILEKKDFETKIEQGTGIPLVRKVCNTIRKEETRVRVLKKLKMVILPPKQRKRKKKLPN